MLIRDAQRDVREAHLSGAPGKLISGVLWLAVAALASLGFVRQAMVGLFVGGLFIFPIAQALTKLLGGSAKLAPDNPFLGLAMQSAFIVPCGWPLVVAAGVANQAWYFSAAALLVAIHYFPFVTLYGMKSYAILAGALLLGAWGCVSLVPENVAAPAWATGLIETAAAFATFALRRRESLRRPA